jgi:hemin uptake protein HemP
MSDRRPTTTDQHRHVAPTPQWVRSEVLLPDGQPLHIDHGGELYTLRRTRSGKLILTK